MKRYLLQSGSTGLMMSSYPLEVIKSLQHAPVTLGHETDGGEKLEHENVRAVPPQRLVVVKLLAGLERMREGVRRERDERGERLEKGSKKGRGEEEGERERDREEEKEKEKKMTHMYLKGINVSETQADLIDGVRVCNDCVEAKLVQKNRYEINL